MAPGHWQVIKRESRRSVVEGKTRGDVGRRGARARDQHRRARRQPDRRGLYGVDLKQVGDAVYVIEVNDNPNIDAGNEDQVLGEALYREVMGVFVRRIAERRRVEYASDRALHAPRVRGLRARARVHDRRPRRLDVGPSPTGTAARTAPRMTPATRHGATLGWSNELVRARRRGEERRADAGARRLPARFHDEIRARTTCSKRWMRA